MTIELSENEEIILDEVQKAIHYCLYCQSFDGGDVIWMYGRRTDVYDLLLDYEITEKQKEKIATKLECPHCGNSSFDISTPVGLQTKLEREIEEHMDEVYGMYGSEVRQFEEELEEYPLLAYKNEFAQKIYNEIADKKLPVTEIIGFFYRSRLVNGDVLDSDEMKNAPTGIPFEGRFNHSGQSHLYLANSAITSIKEVVGDLTSSLVWLQKIEISENVDKILDLSFQWYMLSPSISTILLSLKVYNTIGRSDRNQDNWNPDYFLTRYIMDCAKSLGYNGIKYNSSKTTSDFNVVLFYTDKIIFQFKGDPEVHKFNITDSDLSINDD